MHDYAVRASWQHISAHHIRAIGLLLKNQFPVAVVPAYHAPPFLKPPDRQGMIPQVFVCSIPESADRNTPAGLSSSLLPKLSIVYYQVCNAGLHGHNQTNGVYRNTRIDRLATSI